MLEDDRSDFPEAILMLGDQVYADEVSPKVKEFIEERRGDAEATTPPRSRRSPTSRSTRSSTRRPGPTRRSAGCSRRSRPR